MENIFIDTSIFVADNFLHGTRIKELYRLFTEGRFKNVMPLITVNEIKNQYRKRVEAAIAQHNQAMNNKDFWVLKNFSKGKEIITKFPKPEIVSEEFNSVFDDLLKKAGTEIIPYPTLDTTSIFDKYFKGEKPFGKGDKKHEFPDAIAIESVLEWCKKKKNNCIVLSNDSDLQELKYPRLKIESNYRDFLDKTLKLIVAIEREEVVSMLFNKNKIKLETEVELWLRDELEDTSLYTDAANWLEVHEINIPLVAVSVKDYQIISIKRDIIKVEAIAKANVQIELEIDDESTMYKDPDDKCFYYTDTTQLDIEENFEIPISIEFFVSSKTDYDDKIEIKEFNQGKELEISYSPYD